MSKTLRSVEIASFDRRVKHHYQGSACLRPHVRTRTGVIGATHRFSLLGKGLAHRRTPQADVVPMNVKWSKVTATLTDWEAPEYTDIFDQKVVNFSERDELASNIAMAMGRREDQLILDALGAMAAPTTVGQAGTPITAHTLGQARAKLLNNGVGVKAKLCMASPALWYDELVNDPKVSSADYNTGQATKTGNIPMVHGAKIEPIENREDFEGFDGGGGVGWMFDSRAIGLAIGMDRHTEVNYVPHKTSWLANGIFRAGAVVIDPAGIVKVLGATE